MWETIKNDPILRNITIIILSVLGFGFAFNIMFGPRSNGMGGYSLENTLSYILAIGVKLFLISLVIFAFVLMFRILTKTSNQGGAAKMYNYIKNDSILKTIVIVALSIVGAWLLITVIGWMMTYSMNNGIFRSSMVVGTGYGLGLTGILSLLLKLLLFISVIGVILGVFMFLRHGYSKQITEKLGILTSSDKTSVICPKCTTKVSEGSQFCPQCGEKLKVQCASCDEELKAEWKCCPNCGTDKS
ncbi:MAG TPA: zinc ribbon domain-containing protein [Pseudobacteroides sp.]|uniref:zinc ribbon domain-containing protein n=1 Tax=Pseudobacteroides sp. TaxID=1968840 RepID=UPI002F947E42